MAPKASLALFIFGTVTLCGGAAAVDYAGPIIDMHLHAMRRKLPQPFRACTGDQRIIYPAFDPAKPETAENLEVCAHPILSAIDPAELRDRTLVELRKHHVRRAVVSADLDALSEWVARSDGIVIPASVPADSTALALDQLRRAHAAGKVAIFAELGTQYLGKRADDPVFEPFWALAERLDVPVGIHLGDGMARSVIDPKDKYRAALTSPFQLEAVLIRHPRTRLYVMHAASPLIDEMIAMLFRYPSLYVDVAAIDWSAPRARFYAELQRLIDAGFGERILFGSDQTLFPQAIGLAIDSIEQAPFLSADQKRDILYNNAARFLRLTDKQIAADHR